MNNNKARCCQSFFSTRNILNICIHLNRGKIVGYIDKGDTIEILSKEVDFPMPKKEFERLFTKLD